MNFEITRKGYKKEQVDSYVKQLSIDYENRSAEQRDRIFELKARQQQLEKENAALRGREAEVSRALLSAVQKSSEMEEMAKKKYDLEIQRLKLFHIKWQAYFDDILDRYPLSDELRTIADFTEEMRGILGSPASERRDAPPAPKPNVKTSDAALQYEREKKRLAAQKTPPVAPVTPSSASAAPAAPIDAIHKYLDKNAQSVKPGIAKPVSPSASQKSAMPASATFAAPKAPSPSASASEPASAPAFSLEEAWNPKDDLADILKELGVK